MIKFKRESVENCPCCQNSTRSRIIRDWNNLVYYFCSQCGSAFQDPRIIYEYEENYLGDTNDPDGNIRHLSKERDFKVKNWYGGSVQFVNEVIPGRILDVGAGLGFFLSAIDDAWEKYATEISKYATKYIKERYDNITVFNGNLSKAEFNNELKEVAKEIIFNVDKNGFLDIEHELISDKFGISISKIEEVNDNQPLTYFEALTAAFFYGCRRYKENLVIAEFGLFGRGDAVNILKKNRI